MIRIGTADDIPLIMRLLADLPRPPYYRTEEDHREVLERAINEPRTVLMVDDGLEAICRLDRHGSLSLFTGGWLLPLSLGMAELMPLVVATVKELYRRATPEQRLWPFEWRATQGTDAEGKLDKGKRALETWDTAPWLQGGSKPSIDESEPVPVMRWTLQEAYDAITAWERTS